MASDDIATLVETALTQFGKHGSRFDDVRHRFPSTGSWKPCTAKNIAFWQENLEWSTGQSWAADVDKQTFVVSQFSDKTYTVTCQQIARLFIFHFTGVREMTFAQWQHLGNLIGFNAVGMGADLGTPVPTPQVPRSTYSNTGYVPPWEQGTATPAPALPAATSAPAPSAPRKPGATKRVWEIADSMPGASRGAIIAACEAEGINKNTAGTQYSHWARARKGA